MMSKKSRKKYGFSIKKVLTEWETHDNIWASNKAGGETMSEILDRIEALEKKVAAAEAEL